MVKEKHFTNLEEAAEFEAGQNWQRDQRMGLVRNRERVEMFPTYVEEAKLLLEKYGVGYEPEGPLMVRVTYSKA
jgi:hypothetical protein